LAAVGLVIFWLILPETKGRSLEEMEVLFARPWACPCVLKKGDAPDDGSADPSAAKTVQYVQIRGLNRDHHELDDEDD
jgi:MFS transporter, SP family, solute carrier family 2 (myo-inositol transporter), member 13